MSLVPLALLALGVFCGCVTPLPSLQKRSDDSSPLEVAVAQLSSNLQTLQAQLTALTSKVDSNTASVQQRVAFTVGLKTNVLDNVQRGMTIKFDNVLSNAGSGYDPVVGQFVAPVSGLYVFYYKTEVVANEAITLDLYKEGHVIAHIYAGNSGTYETSGDLEVVHLNQGERLWVVKASGSTGYLRGLHGTRFSGFLLRAD